MTEVSVRLEKENREELKQRGVSGDSLDDVVEKLIKRSDKLDEIVELAEEAGEITV